MSRITMACECCNKVYDLPKTEEIPKHIFFMRCNFCIECDFNNLMTDYYDEWWDEDENREENIPIPIGDNQLVMPFLLHDLEPIKQLECQN